MKASAWRVALRIARRDALRAKGRSALVIAMVALPVLGVTGADVVFRSAELDPGERVVRVMGQADGLLQMAERGAIVVQAPDPEEGYRTADDHAQPKGAAKPPATPEQRRSLETPPDELARQLLPQGSVLVPERQGPYTATSTAQGLLNVRTVEADLTDPVWHGRINLVKGRAPGAGHEVAVTQDFLDRSGLHVGDRTAVRGLESLPFTITGVAEYPGALNATALIARPGALLDPLAALPGAAERDRGGSTDPVRWLVKLPAGAVLDWPKVTEFNKFGFTLASRTVVLDPPARSQVPYYLEEDHNSAGGSYFDRTTVVILATVVGMALLEIVLLAGPAFAVGARRSRRQLGLIAAGGGDRSHVRGVVLGGGVVLGLTGAAIGLGLGVVLVALLRTRAEESSGQRFGHFDVQPLDLLGVLAIGLVTGLLAAVVPAVQASRQEVVAALTGRDSLKAPSRRLALLGVVMVAGGAALALLGATSGIGRSLSVLGGSVVAELGMVALTPYLVGLYGRVGRWLPLGPRLALRDSVRHRGRTAPAVAAVMAAVAGSVAVSVYLASSDEQARRDYVASGPANAVMLGAGWGAGADGTLLPQMRGSLERDLPALGQRADVQQAHYLSGCRVDSECGTIAVVKPKELRCPLDDQEPAAMTIAEHNRLRRADPRCAEERSWGAHYGTLPIGDATLLHNLYGVADPAPGQALAAGKAVVFDPAYLKDGKVILQVTEPLKGGPRDVHHPVVHEITVDAVLASAVLPSAGQAVISPDTAHRLGFSTVDAGSVWLPDAAPSDGVEQKARGALAKLADHVTFDVERGYHSRDNLITLGLSGFAALVALGASGIATGLAAADSQRDLATLAAVGAAPRIRRSLSGFQCGVIAAMGTLLGVVCGIVPAVALRKIEALATAADGPTVHAVVVFPWLHIGLTVVVLPLLAAGLAALLTRSRMTLARRSA
ncbi:FtsX-like permease family protein [Streptomyces kaniharaensis]|uniref:FtsX-like permease family protein n=1 Tax=Streptomyces kaniharaensis TaxID=212423 RepID=A0A6N7KQW9_9ACTN|nr:FtsX-like permease family protein [Streptomyces kaniharaensis]MQS13910.1 FtsX-like permease family protein [Streptomyces kaniharaensis]